MKRILTGSLIGAALTLVLGVGSATASSGPKVNVRVEGASRALLAPTDVRTHSGSITNGGTPRGACPATSAAGALDLATHHHWNGTYNSSFGSLFISSILGEAYTFSSSHYWGVWVNDRYATVGVCSIKLHRGDRLLFAADSVAHHEHPIELIAPGRATVNRAFKVRAEWFTDAGAGRRLTGAHVVGHGVSVTTNTHGVATIVPHHAGTIILRTAHSGYIRATPVRVSVFA